jgi:hypothetical protein
MIVYRTADLIFGTKIHSTAGVLKVGARPVKDLEALRRRLERVDDGKLNEPVTGLMLDLETGEEGLALLDACKVFDAKIPVVAFGSHVATEVLAAARARGADFVMPRSQFSMHLPALLERMGGKVEEGSGGSGV